MYMISFVVIVFVLVASKFTIPVEMCTKRYALPFIIIHVIDIHAYCTLCVCVAFYAFGDENK